MPFLRWLSGSFGHPDDVSLLLKVTQEGLELKEKRARRFERYLVDPLALALGLKNRNDFEDSRQVADDQRLFILN